MAFDKKDKLLLLMYPSVGKFVNFFLHNVIHLKNENVEYFPHDL